MEYKLDPYIMSNPNQLNFQSLTMSIDYQNSHLYNPYMGSLPSTNVNGTTSVSMPKSNIGTHFPMVDLNPNLQVYQLNNQCMSLQMNNVIPPNPYMPNENVPSTSFPNMNPEKFGINTFSNHTTIPNINYV